MNFFPWPADNFKYDGFLQHNFAHFSPFQVWPNRRNAFEKLINSLPLFTHFTEFPQISQVTHCNIYFNVKVKSYFMFTSQLCRPFCHPLGMRGYRSFIIQMQRVKKREEKTQIFGFWAGQSGQIFLAGYIWAVKSSHRWQHLWAKVKI